MCARIEAEKVRKSISTFAPLVTNSPLFTYLAKLGPLSACSRTRRADRAALRPEHAPRRTRTPSLLIRSQAERHTARNLEADETEGKGMNPREEPPKPVGHSGGQP